MTRSLRIFLRLTLLVMACIARPASGQITVRVTDSRSGNPVPLAAVQSMTEGGNVFQTQSTNTDGVARLVSAPAVRFVKVMALGYATVVVEFDGAPDLEVRLQPRALEIDSLTVVVERSGPIPGRLEFSRRREDHSGIFLDPFDVGLKSKYGVVEVFRELEGIRRTGWSGSRMMPRIVSNLGAGCLLYRINNRRVKNANWNSWPLSSLLPQDVMAIEIYRYFGEVPPELRKDAWPPDALHPCGLVLIWTTGAW